MIFIVAFTIGTILVLYSLSKIEEAVRQRPIYKDDIKHLKESMSTLKKDLAIITMNLREYDIDSKDRLNEFNQWLDKTSVTLESISSNIFELSLTKNSIEELTMIRMSLDSLSTELSSRNYPNRELEELKSIREGIDRLENIGAHLTPKSFDNIDGF